MPELAAQLIEDREAVGVDIAPIMNEQMKVALAAPFCGPSSPSLLLLDEPDIISILNRSGHESMQYRRGKATAGRSQRDSHQRRAQ